MGKYFNVDVIPDCIAGDVSDNNGGDVGAGDIIFNWTAVDVPKGGNAIVSISAVVNAEDGAYAAGSLTDYELLFAKSIDGVAPPSLGDINGVQTACGELRHHLIGSARLESSAAVGTLSKTAFHVVYVNSAGNTGNSTSDGYGFPIIMDLEPESGTNVGFDKLYVACFQVTARNYGTGVLLNESSIDASAAPTNSITVDGTDATKIFSVGDQVYVHDLDTPIPGTLTAVTSTTLTFSETNSTVDIAEDDELLNANPIRIKLGFER
tara:strand:+ start:182 stop:976 length:795 start_codon:yes stop_codon:yes gene_type:complete